MFSAERNSLPFILLGKNFPPPIFSFGKKNSAPPLTPTFQIVAPILLFSSSFLAKKYHWKWAHGGRYRSGERNTVYPILTLPDGVAVMNTLFWCLKIRLIMRTITNAVSDCQRYYFSLFVHDRTWKVISMAQSRYLPQIYSLLPNLIQLPMILVQSIDYQITRKRGCSPQ